MPYGRFVGFTREQRREQVGVDSPGFSEERDDLLGRRRHCIVFAGSVELDPVARGKNHHLAAWKTFAKTQEGLGGLLRRESQAFAQIQRHRAMRATHEGERHGIHRIHGKTSPPSPSLAAGTCWL